MTQMHATDADEPNTNHTLIAYSVVKQTPEDGGIRFRADKNTGQIFVKSKLDREVCLFYFILAFGRCSYPK